MTRQPLPHRRPSITREVVWQDALGAHAFTVTIGFDPETGTPREVFAGGKTGTQIAAMVGDWCITASKALQRGEDPAALAQSLHKVPAPFAPGDAHASPFGAIAAAIVEAAQEVLP